MDHFKVVQHIILFCVIATHDFTISAANLVPFNQNYIVQRGGGHVTPLDNGYQVQILLDPNSGGGIRSKYAYGSGYFRMNVKVPRNENGVVTTFYLTSQPDNARRNHNELDFEFVGGTPYILNTNIFDNDSGHREQTFKLWFDPTVAFHLYEILWNQHQIVFLVDNIPIRMLKTNGKGGIMYPKLPMYVQAGLWNASNWRGPPNWSHGPFFANFQGFEIAGCPFDNSNPNICDSPRFSWNAPQYWQLNPKQEAIYEQIKRTRMVYDYCKNDVARKFPECHNQFVNNIV